MPTKKLWKKILYEDQEYPDNYTDKSFLWELKHNIKLKNINLKQAIWGASYVTEEFCTVILFIMIYIYLYNKWWTHESLFITLNGLTILGYIMYRSMDNANLRINLGNDIRTLLIFLVFGHLFTPILHTLTDTISTNTIYTMSFLMLVIHIIFFDYTAPVALISNSFSLSAAMFASICLASRLASTKQAFILITIATQMFVLFPLLRKKLKKPFIMSLLLIIMNYFFLANVSWVMTVVFTGFVIFLNIICPMLYIKCQTYKNNIYGPWDEAIVQDADNINDLLLKKNV